MESHTTLDGKEPIATFGGESYIDDIEFADYGIDFGSVSVSGLTPQQAIQLACTLTDHLMLNGHRFELQKTYEQDQHTRLVCTDKHD